MTDRGRCTTASQQSDTDTVRRNPDSGMSVRLDWGLGHASEARCHEVTERRYLESVALLADIVFDCERPASLARWWASTLDGYRVAPYDSAELERLRDMGVFDPGGRSKRRGGTGTRRWAPLFVPCVFLSRSETRTDLDLRSDDLEGEVTRLVDRGAVELYRIDMNVTMADPEGNEFCISTSAV